LLISAEIVGEVDEVLRRPGFDKYVTEEERLRFLVALVHEAELVAVTHRCAESRDPKDNKFLEVAWDGHAACIVSGDPDLLVLHPFRHIPVLTPRAFLADEWKRQ